MATEMDIGEGTDFSDENSTFDFMKQTWKEDVTFVIDDKRVYASRSVLALFSPVFESMFGSDFKEKKQNEVPLPGKNAEDFVEFLHCLYPTSCRSVTRENAFRVLPLADEYQIPSLLKRCKEVLIEYLTKSDEDSTILDLVKFYESSARHNLTSVVKKCVEKLLKEENIETILSEAEHIMDIDTLLKFKTDVIKEQASRMNHVNTKLVCSTLKTYDIKTEGFEDAAGRIIEHTIENVFDPNLKNKMYSMPVKLWNASFRLQFSVSNKETNGQNEKYLSVSLNCNLPENWSCEVRAAIVLESSFAVKNKIATTKSISKQYGSPIGHTWGYQHFEKLSKFLTGTTKDNENYTGKITAYILAKEPMEEEFESVDDELL